MSPHKVSREEWFQQPGWAIDLPLRLHQVWPWFDALWAFDYGDPSLLAELVCRDPIPEEFKSAIADIIQGKRKPNLKAANKAKIPASERAKIAASISVILGLRDAIKFRALGPNEDLKPGATSVADYCGLEPIEVIRDADETGRDALKLAADEFGISIETVENLLREAKARLSRWPVV